MIGQTKLDYRDFCIEEDDIEVFLESITDSNLAPVIYMNHAADGKVYRATICLLETSEEFVDVKGSLEMYDSKKYLHLILILIHGYLLRRINYQIQCRKSLIQIL